MRDGRRKRLGLQEGTEGTVGDTYLDRILTDAEAAANPYTIAADTDVNFDTRDFRNISDTYNYYYGGGADTAQDDATPPSSGDGGSSDGGTGGGTTPTTGDTTPGTNTPEDQRLIDEGIGLQIGPGQPVFAPGEAPVTQEEIDAFNQIPVSTDYDVPDSTYDEAGLDLNPGGSTYDEAGIQGYQPTYFDNRTPEMLEQAGGTYDGMQSAEGGFGEEVNYTPEQQNTVKNIFGKVGDDVSSALTELGKLPGAIVDATNKTVNVFGKKIDVGKTIGGLILNKIAGGPATFVIEFLKNVLPDGIQTSTKAAKELGLLTGDTTVTQDKYGINTQSQFGDYDQYNVDRVEKLENNMKESKARHISKHGSLDTKNEFNMTWAEMNKRNLQELDDRQKYVDYQTGVGSTYDTADPNIAGSTSVIDTGSVDEAGLDIADQTDIPESTYDEEIFQDTPSAPPINPYSGGEEGVQSGMNTSTPFDASTFDDDVTLTGTPPIGTITPLEDDFEFDTPTGINTGINLRPGKLDQDFSTLGDDLSNELLGNNITGDSTLVAGSVNENIKNDYQNQLDTLNALKEKDADLGLPSGQYDKAIEELEDAIEKIKLEEIKEQTAGLITMTDATTGGDKPQGPGPSGFVGLDEDMDVDPFEFDDMNYEPPAPPSPPSPPTGTDRPGGDSRPAPSAPSAPTQTASYSNEDSYESAAYDAPTQSYQTGTVQRPGSGGGGGGGGGGCFLADTLITMADGSTKEVQKVDLGDNVAEGGKVFATGKFLVENLHDYKGIKVSGSHMVNEDNTWVRVEDSKHGKPLGDDEHTVYVFGSENRRILINGILFTDYFETTEQEKLINDEKDFFNNWKTYENKIDQDNINILNAS